MSGKFDIGPDGTVYLPRLRSLYVEGLTLEELRALLIRKYRTYVHSPHIFLRQTTYRPIRIYVTGEVRRPGFYTLSQITYSTDKTYKASKPQDTASFLFPTVFDAIRAAQGTTPFSDLSAVQVTRKRAKGLGGGVMRTNLNFLSMILEGDESQNIRLYDGDTLKIKKSPVIMREQLIKAGQSNLTSDFMKVYVTGRVNIPGDITIPQGTSLNQAIAVAGGVKWLRGKISFIRFNNEGSIDRKIFAYQPGAAANTESNPILMSGDLIRVEDTFLIKATSTLNELTSPFVSIYSAYALFNTIGQ